jgi:hypothetical protein
MVRKVVIAAAAAVLVGTFLGWSNAMARGGGSHGGVHGGSMSAFHSRAFIGARRGGSNWGRTASRGSRFHNSGAHHDGSRGADRHGADRRNAHADQGHWRQSPGFGDNGHKSSNNAGEWHRSPGFGDSRHNASNADGEWHVDR